ncbi:MAG: hypothetical protein Q7T38_01405 [Gallionella sp.]|nr:hypothetical protein [Gallionella sp.]
MSLHDLLERYFTRVEAVVAQLPAYTENYVEEILTAERANLRIRLRFQSGGLLEINEAVIVEKGMLKTLGYRYHLQSAGNELMFRYDTRFTSLRCRLSRITSIFQMPSWPQASLICLKFCKKQKFIVDSSKAMGDSVP